MLNPTATADAATADQRESVLLELFAKIRNTTDLPGLTFVATNETHSAIPYFQALIWHTRRGKVSLRGVSGAAVIDPKAGAVRHLTRLLRKLSRVHAAQAQRIDARTLEPEIQTLWLKFLPRYGLILPFKRQRGDVGLLLTREVDFLEDELAVLRELGDAYSSQWYWLDGGDTGMRRRRKRYRRLLATGVVVAGLLLVSALVRVSGTGVGNVEIVAANPATVAAPIKGVIERILVDPHDAVLAGQPIVQYVSDELENDLDIAKQNLLVAVADLEHLRQTAITKQSTRTEVELARLLVEQRQIELDYASKSLERAIVRAPTDGLALYSDANEWIGRPVQVGERILSIADVEDVYARIWIAPRAFSNIEPADPVDVYLDIAPGENHPARVTKMALNTELNADGDRAYRVDARFDDGTETPRIGLTGNARVHGNRISLLSYITRRPQAWLRQKLGELF